MRQSRRVFLTACIVAATLIHGKHFVCGAGAPQNKFQPPQCSVEDTVEQRMTTTELVCAREDEITWPFVEFRPIHEVQHEAQNTESEAGDKTSFFWAWLDWWKLLCAANNCNIWQSAWTGSVFEEHFNWLFGLGCAVSVFAVSVFAVCWVSRARQLRRNALGEGSPRLEPESIPVQNEAPTVSTVSSGSTKEPGITVPRNLKQELPEIMRLGVASESDDFAESKQDVDAQAVTDATVPRVGLESAGTVPNTPEGQSGPAVQDVRRSSSEPDLLSTDSEAPFTPQANVKSARNGAHNNEYLITDATDRNFQALPLKRRNRLKISCSNERCCKARTGTRQTSLEKWHWQKPSSPAHQGSPQRTVIVKREAHKLLAQDPDTRLYCSESCMIAAQRKDQTPGPPKGETARNRPKAKKCPKKRRPSHYITPQHKRNRVECQSRHRHIQEKNNHMNDSWSTTVCCN